MDFRSKYGPWAVVAGASEGLGAAFAEALAARGLNLLLLARRNDLLDTVAAKAREMGVEARAEMLDVGRADFAEELARLTADLEVGCGVYNAAAAPIGEFLDRSLEELLRVVDVNVRGPLAFARTLAPPMAARGRGGIVLMSSLAGFQGAPNIATYAASKAFNMVLAEGLWSELTPKGIDVLVSCAGAIRTPGYASAAANTKEAPGTLDAVTVANRSLDALGEGPSVIPGGTNRFARFVLGRLLPRRAAIGIMAKSTRELS
jgi:short-subunit dehydrogenase